MLKTLFAIALFALMAAGLVALGSIAILLLVIALSREPQARGASKEEPPAIPGPKPEEEASLLPFRRLLAEAADFALTPGVVVLQEIKEWPYGAILARTTSDFYGRRVYVETYRRYAGKICRVLCRYDDGSKTPAEVASAEFDLGDACVGVYEWTMREIEASGAHVFVRDERNLFWEMRATREGAKAHA